MAAPNKPHRDWIDLLQQANLHTTEKPAKGFKSMREWLDDFGITETTWRRKIPLLEAQGIMERGYYRVHQNGRTIKKPFWRKK